MDKEKVDYNLDFGDVVFSTDNQKVFDEHPVVPAKKMYPEWIKHIPKHSTPTLKSCPGVINLYKHGYILPAWTDMFFIINPDKSYKFEAADMNTFVFTHPEEEYYGFFSDHVQIKIVSPWEIKTISKKTMALEPTWNHCQSIFRIVPGIADTDYYPQCTNIQTFWPTKSYTYEIKINKGDALLHFILI